MSLELQGSFADIEDFQHRYQSLLELCDREGTLIVQNRRIELDPHIPPYQCYRRARSIYVFPRQGGELLKDLSMTLFAGRSDKLWVELQRFGYDSDRVVGKMIIEYKDADLSPHLRVSFEHQRLPDAVVSGLEEVFSD